MQTFKAFAEEWENLLRKYEGTQNMDYRHKIGPHKLFMHFHHNKSFKGGRDAHYKIHFMVNSSIKKEDGKDIEPAHKHAILHHVHKTIDRFVRHRKPSSIELYANEKGAKDKLYGKLAKRIAKKHGGKYRQRSGAHQVAFDKKWHKLGYHWPVF